MSNNAGHTKKTVKKPLPKIKRVLPDGFEILENKDKKSYSLVKSWYNFSPVLLAALKKTWQWLLTH